MTKRVARYVIALFALCLTTSPMVSTRQAQPVRAPAAGASAELTIVGCLMKTDTSAHRAGTSYSTTNGKGGSPATANGGAGTGFALKDAAIVTTHAASSATEGSEKRVEAGFQEFRAIAGDATLNLRDHVGTEVEVQGRLVSGEASRLNVGGNAIAIAHIKTIAKDCERR